MALIWGNRQYAHLATDWHDGQIAQSTHARSARRSIGYNAAAVNNDKTAMKDVVAQLVRTERNFKLKKDERTLYRVDETYNDLGELLKEAMKIKRSKSTKG